MFMKYIHSYRNKGEIYLKMVICLPIHDENHKIVDSWHISFHKEGIY